MSTTRSLTVNTSAGVQIPLVLTEDASERIEAILARHHAAGMTCKAHPDTVLNAKTWDCPTCEADEAAYRRYMSQQPSAGWVRRAIDKTLPSLVIGGIVR